MTNQDLLVVGAGVMGIGIAQIAAQSGHRVFLYDQRKGAAKEGFDKVKAVLDKLLSKGKITADEAEKTIGRLHPVSELSEAQSARIVVEAIVEDLEAKQSLFETLESLLVQDAILATNTSSISVTAIAAKLKHPERVVGMHFFNPVPLMALVEVVRGLRTASEVAGEVERLARRWGKTPVHARNTPGFIVNRIARPYYAEALLLLQDKSLEPEVLDVLMRSSGFRMGPCELMDLIGHDTNFAVTKSVFEAYFFDRRFTPSLVQKELVDGGLLGRKTGQGFYSYPDGRKEAQCSYRPFESLPDQITLHGKSFQVDQLHEAIRKSFQGTRILSREDSEWQGLEFMRGQIRVTEGQTALQIKQGNNVENISIVDELPSAGGALAFASSGSADWVDFTGRLLASLGFSPFQVSDTPGLVVARTWAMLANEASDAVFQGVCSEEAADSAMKLGVNYPKGPFEWLSGVDRKRVVSILNSLDERYRGERYRVSPWLLQ